MDYNRVVLCWLYVCSFSVFPCIYIYFVQYCFFFVLFLFIKEFSLLLTLIFLLFFHCVSRVYSSYILSMLGIFYYFKLMYSPDLCESVCAFSFGIDITYILVFYRFHLLVFFVGQSSLFLAKSSAIRQRFLQWQWWQFANIRFKFVWHWWWNWFK